MLIANEDQVLAAFELVHGKISGNCHAEVVYDDDFEMVAVACMKNGNEAWRATLAEITLDLLIKTMPELNGNPSDQTENHHGTHG